MPRSRSRAHEPVRGSVCFDLNAADLERIDPLTGDAIVTDECRKNFKTVIDRPTLFPGDSVFAVSIDLCGVIVMVWSRQRSEEHTSELQSLMRISYAVFFLKKKHINTNISTLF